MVPTQQAWIREIPGGLALSPAVSSSAPRVRVLAFHGYGQSSESLLSLAFRSALPDAEWILPRLPGHGTDGDSELNLSEARRFTDAWIAETKPTLLFGFSLGARLALSRGDVPSVVVSAPVLSTFGREDREEILTFLNPRRVREVAPMAGLTEILDGLSVARSRTAPSSLYYAQRDLRSVRDGVASLLEIEKLSIRKIERCNHGDILDTPELAVAMREAMGKLPA